MQRCEIFGTKVSHGNNVSHSKRATKRIWRPNLQTMLLTINNEEVRVRVCTKAMKTLKGKLYTGRADIVSQFRLGYMLLEDITPSTAIWESKKFKKNTEILQDKTGIDFEF